MVSDDSALELNRRRWLSVTALAVAGTAGCVQQSGGSPDGSGTARQQTDTRTTTGTPSPTDTATDTPSPTPPPEAAPASVLGGRLDAVGNFDGEIANRRGESTVTVEVGAEGNGGNFGFAPPAVHVDRGTTVRWKWTGNGGAHNVVSGDDGPLDSGDVVAEPGVHYEYTFEEDGVYLYNCAPHAALGMGGAVVVGDDYEALTPTETPTPHYDEPEDGEQEGGGGDGTPADVREFDGWLDGVENYEGVVYKTGRETVRVWVAVEGNGGAFAFGPPAVVVDPGTTVRWHWTGEGGAHNVVAEDGAFDSGSPVPEEGVNFEYTFEDVGVYRYYCAPHRALGMRGVVVASG